MKRLKQGAIMVCPECMAFIAHRKTHRKWHEANRPIPGPPGPQGPQGAMGMTGEPGVITRVMPTDQGHAAPDLLEGWTGDGR